MTTKNKNTLSEKVKEFNKNIFDKIKESYSNRENAENSVFNNIAYTENYIINKKRGMGFSPPKEKKGADRKLTMGLIPEKVSNYISILLDKVIKYKFKVYDNSGNIQEGLGNFFDLSVKHSFQKERFNDKILPLILNELFTQGDAFTWDKWEVENKPKKVAYDKNGKKVDMNYFDVTYEALEELTYKEESQQTRKAKTVLLDGRVVILASMSENDLQKQPFIALEFIIPKSKADSLFGSLKNYKNILKDLDKEGFETVLKEDYGDNQILKVNRMVSYDKNVLVHYYFDKENDLYNVFVNGFNMLPINTPMSIWQPRFNYPITQFSSERVPNSAYSRSVPAKIKWMSDYLDWQFNVLANKFEELHNPALLVKSPFLLRNRDMFKAGKRTLNVDRSMYEMANPNQQGIVSSDIEFTRMIKETLESQTLNKTTTGELSGQTTATEIGIVDKNQNIKLANIISGFLTGYYDLVFNRATTIEYKYSSAKEVAIVDGKEVPIYQNFSVNAGGMENYIEFRDGIETLSEEEIDEIENEMFKKEQNELESGKKNKYHIISPKYISEGNFEYFPVLKADKKRNSSLDKQDLMGEVQFLKSVWPNVNDKVLQKEYEELTDRDEDLFLPADIMGQGQPQLPQEEVSSDKRIRQQ